MEQKPQRFLHIVRAKGADVSDDFIAGNEPVIISANSHAVILLDNGVHTVGFPELIVSAGKGSKIKITYSEALFKRAKDMKSDGHISLIDRKGNRNETEGKEIFGVYDLFYPDGGQNRLFRPLWKRTFRFVQLNIETGEQDLIINDFSSVFMGYPFKEIAKFESDDSELTKIWQAAWRTLRNGADEIYQDTPYYEQLQYIGDTRLSSITSVYVSGDDRLMRKALKQFDDSRITVGLTQSRYPAYIKQIITPFSLFWIGMIHDFYWYRNDPEFLRQFLPGIRAVLEWFEQFIDKDGMIAATEWWNFTDWIETFPNGIPPGADNGPSANISFQYLYALKNAVELFEYFGWSIEAEKYSNLYSVIKASVYNRCFDKQRGLFAETPAKKNFSQHTNIMAVLGDALSESEQRDLMQKVLEDKNIAEATLYFKFYLFRALQKVGLGNKYLYLLTPWKKMLADGLTTFAEMDTNPRSDCHPWGSTPCFDYLHTVAGIYPLEPGFTRLAVEPNFAYLNKISAQMPIPQGIVKVELVKNGNNSLKGVISLPQNVTGVFRWQGESVKLHPGGQSIFIENAE
jgi:hypothetical protein